MGVKLTELKNKGGKIRDTVIYDGRKINVFEPTAEQVDEIIKMQEFYINQAEDGTELNVEGEALIKIFSMLTDIEGLDSLTDKELFDIIENPSLALLEVEKIVEDILADIYKIILLQAKKQLNDLFFEQATIEALNETALMADVETNKNQRLKEKRDKLTKAKEKVFQLEQDKQKQEKPTKSKKNRIFTDEELLGEKEEKHQNVIRDEDEQKALLKKYKENVASSDDDNTLE